MIPIIDIFLSFIKIGLFAFGGAYAVLPLIEEQMVTNTKWMSFKEFSDLVAIDELTPGPIIVNSSTFIGMKLGGIPGAIVATLACIIPGCTLALILFKLYKKYKEIPVISEVVRDLKCMSVALIFSVLIKMFINTSIIEGDNILSSINYLSVVLIIISFYILRKYKTNPLIVMLGCGIITLLLSFIV